MGEDLGIRMDASAVGNEPYQLDTSMLHPDLSFIC
jgi:hypothetical protein